MAQKKVTYREPADYIPKAIRKELGLGEFNTSDKKKTPAKKTTSAKKKA